MSLPYGATEILFGDIVDDRVFNVRTGFEHGNTRRVNGTDDSDLTGHHVRSCLKLRLVGFAVESAEYRFRFDFDLELRRDEGGHFNQR